MTTLLDRIGAALDLIADHVPERARGDVLKDARVALAELRAVEPVAWMTVSTLTPITRVHESVEAADYHKRMLDWDEDCGETTIVPLYAAPQASGGVTDAMVEAASVAYTLELGSGKAMRAALTAALGTVVANER